MPSSIEQESGVLDANAGPSRRVRTRVGQIDVLAGDFANQRQLWATIWERRFVVLSVAFGVSGLVLLYTLIAGIRFLSTAQLYLGEVSMTPPSPESPSGSFGLNEPTRGLVASEIEILQSVALVRKAVLDSGVNVTVSASGAGSMPYWKWLLIGRNPDSVDLALDAVRPTNTQLARSAREPRAYTVRFVTPAEYEVRVKETNESLGSGTVGTPFVGADLSMTLLAGTGAPPARGAQYDLLVSPLDLVIDRVLSRLKITVPKQTAAGADINVVTLEYSNASPQLASRFLDRLMSAYLDERQSWKTEDASAAEAFVTSQLGGVRNSLDQLQAKLAEYRRGNPLVVLDDETRAMVEQVGKYEEQRAATRLEVAALGEMKRTVDGPNPPIGAFLLGEANDPVLASMAESLAQAREKMADLQSRYNDVAPDVRQQGALVADQLEAIRSYIGSRSRRAQANLHTLDSIVEQFDAKLKTVPAAELGLAQLTRESEVYNKTYSYLLERQQAAAIFKASTLSKNRVLSAPEVPLRVDSPNIFLRAASFAVGLVLGAAFVVARALFTSSFYSVLDARRSLVGVPILAVVPPKPALRRPRRGSGEEPPLSFDVLALPSRAAAFAEAFRALRATLLGWRITTESGIAILVTSPQAGDGKTTFVLSLAGALSAGGQRVLVIDTNLRRPSSDGVEETEGTGLKGVLRGIAEWRSSMDLIELKHSSFYALSAGGHDVPELMTINMPDLIGELRSAFDFILMDSASFPEASDALVLSQLTDVTLSIVRIQQTPRALTSEHLNALLAHTSDLAVIVNDAVDTPSGRSEDEALQRAPHYRAEDRRPRKTPSSPRMINGIHQAAAQDSIGES